MILRGFLGINMKLEIKTVREILRLRQLGLSLSEVAARIGCSKSAVKKYVDRAKDNHAEHYLAIGLDNTSLGQILQPTVRNARGLVDPNWEAVFIEHTQSDVPLAKIWENYVSQVGEEKALKYSAFCENYKRYTCVLPDDLIDGYLALEWRPGEYVQIDYSGDGIPITDTAGKTTIAQIFVAVLPYSGYTFAYATADQKRDSWLDSLIKLFRHLGGVPTYVVLDNTKALVIKASKYNPVLCPEFKTFCRFYGVVPDAVNPHSPRQKGAVENAVKNVQASIIKPLAGHRFFDLDSLNAKIETMLVEFNDRPVKSRGGLSRKDLAVRETVQLHPLPEAQYELSVEIKILTVRKDGCVRLGNSRYSVPYRYIGKKVEVRIMPRARLVAVVFDGQKIAEHAYKSTELPTITRRIEHLRPEQRFVLMPPEEMIAEIGQCGPKALQFSQYLHKHLPTALLKRQLQGCMYLMRQAGAAVFEECCAETLKCTRPNLETLQAKISATLKEQEPSKPAVKKNTHSMAKKTIKSSFRGAAYYQDAANEEKAS